MTCPLADAGAFGMAQAPMDLSRHLRVLEDAGYVVVEKGYDKRRPRTWIAITPKGAKAFAREVAVLRALIAPVSNPVVRTNLTDKGVTDKGKSRQTAGKASRQPRAAG